MHHTSKKILIGLLILSILISLSGCEVEFTPDITPLNIEDISPGQQFEEIPGQESEFVFPLDGNSKIYPGLTSDMAIDLCSEYLLWGDEVFGMCLPPGGMYYFFWTQRDEVLIIELDPQDSNQAGFREAVHDRASNIKKAKQNFNRLVPRG